MLWLVWIASFVLGLAAILIMIVLVIARLLQERRQSRETTQRRRVHSALIRFSGDGDRSALASALAPVPNSVVADAGFEFLDLLRGGERDSVEAVFAEIGLPAFIRRRLRRGNEADRIHASEMLVSFPGEETVRSLNAALKRDRAREVRIAVAIALSTMGALPPLDDVLSMIGARGQRSRRLIALLQSLPPERFEELAGYATQKDCPAFVRAAAVDALSLTGDYRFLPLFEKLAGDRAPEVAAAAIRALGRSGHPAASATLIAAMESRDWQIRAEAADAAGRIGLDDAIEHLSALLGDGEWAVRYAAGKSLQGLGTIGMEALRRIAEDEGSRSQRTASMVLAEGRVR